MQSIADAVRERGHLAATHELYADGYGRSDLSQAVRSGHVVRVRQGWYLSPHVAGEVREAIRVGGRVTCVTALRLHGIWAPSSSTLHVAVKSTDSRLRSRNDKRRRLAPGAAKVHWTDLTGGTRLMVDRATALIHALECLPADVVTACANDAVRQDPGFLGAWREAAPSHALLDVDGVCESGTEYLFWLRMRRRLQLQRQVWISEVGRVDFLIGDRLIVEIDGLAYHVDPERFEADRRRDAFLSALGYRVLRFSYQQVMTDWPSVERAVLAAVARADHL